MRLLPALLAALVATPTPVPAQASRDAAAPRPLFRDPVHDGAADASTVYDRKARVWRMFYTNRRANLPLADEKDVSWVHGTHIGQATSRDGRNWRYAGVTDIPAACTGATLWAPEVGWFAGRWHMWLTVVPGVFRDWNAPRFIVHLTSPDLKTWRCGERLDLGSDRVIDASVAEVAPGRYRLWFNDERKGKAIVEADTTDLVHWTVGRTIVTTPGEGPKAFRWRGRWWLVSDAWKGLLVLSSPDARDWTRQPGFLLGQPGRHPTDSAKGQHPDIVVSGDRAFVIYFVHQDNAPQATSDPRWRRRSVLQIAELHERDGALSVDRDAPQRVRLVPPRR